MDMVTDQLRRGRRHGELMAAASLRSVERYGAPALAPPTYRLKRRPNGMWAIFCGHAYVDSTRTRNRRKAKRALIVYTLQQEAKRARIQGVANADAIEIVDYYESQIPEGTRALVDARTRLNRLRPYLKGKTLPDLNGAFIKMVTKKLAKIYAAGSIYGIIMELRTAIRVYCREHGSAVIMPFAAPKTAPPKTRVLSGAEFALVRRWAMGSEDYDPATGIWSPVTLDVRQRHVRKMVWRLLVLGLLTGTRLGRLQGLAWTSDRRHGHIDLKRGVLYRCPPGTPAPAKKRAPALRLSPELRAELRRWKAADDALGHRYIIRKRGGAPEDAGVGWLFSRVMRRLGLRDVTLHTLRHTFVSAMIAAGVAGSVICAVAGMSMQTLRQHYNHVDDLVVQPMAHRFMDRLFHDGLDALAA
jgi:integrase